MIAHSNIRGLSDEAFLVALANTGHGTEDDPGAPDELRDAASVRSWWQELTGSRASGPAGTAKEVATLRSARAAVRQLTLRNNGVAVQLDPGSLAGLPLRFELGAAGPGLTTAARSTLALDLAARAALAMIRWSGTPSAQRLKACPGPGCGWVFRDTTRNGSRRWCAMAACGNRAKAAAFRARGRS